MLIDFDELCFHKKKTKAADNWKPRKQRFSLDGSLFSSSSIPSFRPHLRSRSKDGGIHQGPFVTTANNLFAGNLRVVVTARSQEPSCRRSVPLYPRSRMRGSQKAACR